MGFQRNVYKRKMTKMNMKKRGIIKDYLPWILIAVAVLVLAGIAIFVLRGEGSTLIARIKDLLGRG